MKHFNYENDVVPKCFCFYMKLLFLSFLQKKNIKIERTCEELLEDIMTLAADSEITKKLHDDLKLVVKKGADKSFQLT